MARGFHVVGLATALLFAALSFLGAGCQPLYGSAPERLHKIDPKKRPPEADVAAAPITYKEDCPSDFRGDPKRVIQQTSISQQLTSDGDNALANADRAKEPAAQAGLIKDSIDKYRNALLKDPYNIDATLKLALAYDKVLYKGCAIAMLKRLSSLSNNPKWQKEANRTIDSVVDNSSWFKGYRKDATAAVGR